MAVVIWLANLYWYHRVRTALQEGLSAILWGKNSSLWVTPGSQFHIPLPTSACAGTDPPPGQSSADQPRSDHWK